MIVQYDKKLNYTKPTDLFNHIIDTYKDEQYMKDYVLSASSEEILKRKFPKIFYQKVKKYLKYS